MYKHKLHCLTEELEKLDLLISAQAKRYNYRQLLY